MTIKLIDVIEYYAALPHQTKAIDYLQSAIPADVLAKFAELWRDGHTPEPKPKQPRQLISMQQATNIFGRAPLVKQFWDLNACLARFDITSHKRMKQFLPQIGHESGGLRHTQEINSGWYIPEKFGLPRVADVDGKYMYRGAGWLQMSMPENYLAFSKYMGDRKIYDLGCPYVAENYPGTASGFWWMINGMNARCDRGDTLEQISRMVNLGGAAGVINGLADRQMYFDRATKVLG